MYETCLAIGTQKDIAAKGWNTILRSIQEMNMSE